MIIGTYDADHVVACDYVGIESGSKVADKMAKTGFTTTKSEFVDAPVINELSLALECELIKVIDGCKYLGKIKNVSADEKILDESGSVSLAKFFPIIFDPSGNGYYKLGEKVGQAWSSGMALK